MKPNNIATPPRRGIGTVWMSRSRTAVIAPVLKASHRTNGVVA